MTQPLELSAHGRRRRTQALCALPALLAAAACAAQTAAPDLPEGPFAYPASLLAARSTYTVSPATPVLLGSTVVVLEQSRLGDVAAIVRAPVHVEGSGEDARRWVCAEADDAGRPLKLWFISSSGETVTEVQMRPGSFSGDARCGRLSAHFEPVYLSRIASGMKLEAVVRDIGPASAHDAQGWNFWVSRRTYDYYGQSFTEYVWVGARVSNEGVVGDVFTAQITR